MAKETGSEILEIEVLAEPVHLLCQVDPQFGIAKFVRTAKVSLSPPAQNAELTALNRRAGLEWLKAADSQALQESLRDLDRAFVSFC